MSNLANMERVDYTLFTCSQEGNVNFNIYNTVLLGRKGAEERKLDPIFMRSYESQKYSNKDTLDNMRIGVSNYLVFSYNDWDNRVSEEIFVSYPNITDLNDFIESIIEQIVLNEKCFDKRNNVSPAYEDLQLVSEPLASNKVMKAIPYSIVNEEYKEKGVALFINDDDNYIMITAKAMYGIYVMLSEFNLLTNSQLTLSLALAGNSEGSVSSGRKLEGRPASPLKRKPSSLSKKKLNMNEEDDEEEDYDDEDEPAPKKRLKPRKKLAKIEEADDEVFDNDSDDEDDEEAKPTKKLKPRKKVKVEEPEDEDNDEEEVKPKKKSKKKLSMKSIKEAVDEDDEEEDFD